ncbi:MAG: Bug family tripartite tricarboxylate transporter substrate binding protein [Xanthobacteraceae bacterium]
MKTPVHRSALPSRRRILQAGATFTAAAPFLSTRAYAAWPERPIRMIVPFGSGGPVDVVTRLLQPALSDALKASMFIENKPGAAGNIGVGLAARAEPDGHTMLITSNTIVINPLLYKTVPYDLARDFVALVDIAGSPTAFTVNPKSGINSVAELIALAKQKPGGLNYSSAGFATPAHLAAEFFRSRAGIQMTHVPFNGAGPANQAAIAGTVDMASGALPGAHPHIVAGTLKGIAVTGEKRWFDLPNIPTMVEAGYPGFVLDTYVMMLMPAKTPPDIVERVSTATLAALKNPDVLARVRKAGLEVSANGPAELQARIARERPLWQEVVKVAGITPQ